MKKETLQKLRVPGEHLKPLTLKSGDFTEGILRGGDGEEFAIRGGIPRLLDNRYDQYTQRSFSAEWHELEAQDDVWGRPVLERMKELKLLEMSPAKLRGLDFLDVGCGNGLFARTVAMQFQANVIATDISTGVEIGRRAAREDENIDFVQADMRFPPFKNEAFDIIWCAGSLHHTKDPRLIFKRLAPLLKRGGRIFVWLYAKGKNRPWKWYARRITKNIVCRLPVFLQNTAVLMIACFTMTKQFILVRIFGRKPHVPFVPKLRHHRMMARDSYTIRYDWHFTTDDVVQWHKECGLKTIYSKYVTESDGDWLAGLAEKE